MPRLIIQSEEFIGTSFELNQEIYRVGRLEDNEVSIPHTSISGHHAELVLDGLDYRIKDLGSTNGTRVNDERVKESNLRRNDVLRFGNIDVLYDSEHTPVIEPLPDPTQEISLDNCASQGKPEDFVNLSSHPKTPPQPPWKLLYTLAALFALSGFAFFLVKLFLLTE